MQAHLYLYYRQFIRQISQKHHNCPTGIRHQAITPESARDRSTPRDRTRSHRLYESEALR